MSGAIAPPARLGHVLGTPAPGYASRPAIVDTAPSWPRPLLWGAVVTAFCGSTWEEDRTRGRTASRSAPVDYQGTAGAPPNSGAGSRVGMAGRRPWHSRGRMSRTSDRRWDVQVAAAACLCGAAVTWACAWVVRRQHQLVVELRQAQEALAAGAASEERARIAREVHDVIAHSLTVTLLHVSAARLAAQDRPEDAVAALAEAERLGRRSLADVRRAVGLLGPAEDGRASAPLPSAADIPALVAEYRAAGVHASLAVTGDVDILSSATSLALYRIAEESLANAARHAPGAPVEVELGVEGGRAVLRIVNGAGSSAPPLVVDPRPGLGRRGIHQRTELIGGKLQEGPFGTGWRVEVEVPLDGDGP